MIDDGAIQQNDRQEIETRKLKFTRNLSQSHRSQQLRKVRRTKARDRVPAFHSREPIGIASRVATGGDISERRRARCRVQERVEEAERGLARCDQAVIQERNHRREDRAGAACPRDRARLAAAHDLDVLALRRDIRERAPRARELARVRVAERREVRGDGGRLVRRLREDVREAAGGEGRGGLGRDAGGRTDGGHEGAPGGEGRHEGRAARGLRAGDAAVSRGEEDGGSARAELHVRVAQLAIITISLMKSYERRTQLDVLGKTAGDGVLVLAVRGREDVRRAGLAEQEVDDIEEPAERAVLRVLADGDERRRDAARHANRVLNIQVRLDARLVRALGVASAVERLQRERRRRAQVWAVRCQERAQVCGLRELVDEPGDAEDVRRLRGLGGRDPVERLEAGGRDGGRAGCGDGAGGEVLCDGGAVQRRGDDGEVGERVVEAVNG